MKNRFNDHQPLVYNSQDKFVENEKKLTEDRLHKKKDDSTGQIIKSLEKLGSASQKSLESKIVSPNQKNPYLASEYISTSSTSNGLQSSFLNLSQNIS